ncbi:MAG: hypothetical protein ACLT9P_02115 [Evtepia gabavorous]
MVDGERPPTAHYYQLALGSSSSQVLGRDSPSWRCQVNPPSAAMKPARGHWQRQKLSH